MLRKVLPQFFLSQSSIPVVICSDKNIQDQRLLRVNAPFFLESRVYLTQARNSGPFDFLCINLYNNYIPFSFFLTRLSSSFFHSTTALHRASTAVWRSSSFKSIPFHSQSPNNGRLQVSHPAFGWWYCGVLRGRWHEIGRARRDGRNSKKSI